MSPAIYPIDRGLHSLKLEGAETGRIHNKNARLLVDNEFIFRYGDLRVPTKAIKKF